MVRWEYLDLSKSLNRVLLESSTDFGSGVIGSGACWEGLWWISSAFMIRHHIGCGGTPTHLLSTQDTIASHHSLTVPIPVSACTSLRVMNPFPH